MADSSASGDGTGSVGGPRNGDASGPVEIGPAQPLRFDVITLFPAQFNALTDEGVVARAIGRGLADLHLWNPRDFTDDPNRRVDDRPFGGGPGMVLRYEPLQATIAAARAAAAGNGTVSRVAYLSPQGRVLDQAAFGRIAAGPGWILIAGRYEGVDERLLEDCVDEEWSIGDYVLSGGELPAMVVIDAAVRLLPGALGHADSAREDSHMGGLLDCPHYTRPAQLPTANGPRQVPAVLLGGDHQAIGRWRLQQALGRTWLRRPDLLQRRGPLSGDEQRLLDDFIRAQQGAGTEPEQ